MEQNLISSAAQIYSLKHSQTFLSRSFLVKIVNEKDEVIFYPYMISNFSVDSKKIFITIYDMMIKENIEETLDELKGSFWKRKPKFEVILYKLANTNEEIYHVEYTNCKLKNYHGKNFSYKSNDLYQWYLEIEFGKKKIIKTDEMPISKHFFPKNYYETIDKSYKEYDLAVYKNSNKMLDNSILSVKQSNRIDDYQKDCLTNIINHSKAENIKKMQDLYGIKSLDDADIQKMSDDLEAEIDKMESKINK